MSLQLSVDAEAILNSGLITPTIIVEIQDIGFLFSTIKVVKLAKIGGYVIGDGTKIGGGVVDENSKALISFKGTTNNITQSVEVARAQGNSVTSFKLELVDKSDILTNIFSPSVLVDDILGKEAIVYYMPDGGVFERDANKIFYGIIDKNIFGAGNVTLNIAHPEQLKRQEILPKYSSNLTSSISDSDTTIPVSYVTGFFLDNDALTSYIRIEDEIIKVGNISGNDFTGCTRGVLNTIASIHADDSDVESFYRLQGDAIDLPLKLMISGVGSYGSQEATRFVQVDSLLTIPNAVHFDIPNVADRYGLVKGDLISCSLATDGANNFTDRTILNFGTDSLGSYIIVDGTSLNIEINSSAVCTFKSQYDVLDFGCAIKPYHIDVQQYVTLKSFFGTSFLDYDFYIKDTIKAKEFIDEQLYFPSALYSIPRKGRISVAYSAPPLGIFGTKTINSKNIIDPQKIKISRSINDNFYNAIVYKFEQDSIDDRFLKGNVYQSTNSTNRIKVGNKTLVIEAEGLRNTDVINGKIDILSQRFLDRFQYGAESLEINVKFATGYPVDIGDAVVLEGAEIKLSDTRNGTRDFATRVMEVVNKSINLKNGEVTLTILDTNYSNDGRYFVFSPASLVAAGSDTQNIKLKLGPWSNTGDIEGNKWIDYVGQKIQVRNTDFSIMETVGIQSISPFDSNTIIVSPALSFTPLEDYIIETPEYDDTSPQAMSYWKAVHGYLNPRVYCTAGTTTSFDVSPSDIGKFFENSRVRIHLPDFSEDITTTVLSISINTVTIKQTSSFTITSNHIVDLIGFVGDKGLPYLFF